MFAPIDGTTFDESLIVEATCATEGASIYYTTNGDEPTTGSDKFLQKRGSLLLKLLPLRLSL
ncbi:chitobiase/beta-hexosaminidase C-terminal domain-containing protein [Paraprevotella clara]|uniref:chitobiase/beta-hexosaminidase C-terminal domain-containing protein n=1 Tax=Paraprevotella clara TaxID=454154 RepID=UPI00300E8025